MSTASSSSSAAAAAASLPSPPPLVRQNAVAGLSIGERLLDLEARVAQLESDVLDLSRDDPSDEDYEDDEESDEE